MSVWQDLLGTTSSIFGLGKTGPKIKNNSGVVEFRNNADNAQANINANLNDCTFPTLNQDTTGSAAYINGPAATDINIQIDSVTIAHFKTDGNIYGDTGYSWLENWRGIIIPGGVIAVSASQYLLNGSGEIASINWDERTLVASDGTTVVADWTSGLSIPTEDLTFGGSAQRILGDFSNATLANRLLFQTTAENATSLGVIPGAGYGQSQIIFFNSTDPDNSGILLVGTSSSAVYIDSNKTGSASINNLELRIGDITKLTLTGSSLLANDGIFLDNFSAIRNNDYETVLDINTGELAGNASTATALADVSTMALSTIFIPVVVDGTYTLSYHPGFAGTLTGIGEKAKSLTTAGTFKIQIDGVDVTGLTDIAPSTAGSFTASTAANTFTATSEITVVYAGTALVAGHTLTLNCTQQL